MDILVVEDNFLAGEMIRLAIEDAHFNVVGPATSVDEGLRLAGETELDGALLDINVGGHQAFPLARLLQTRGVPFIFLTGYDRTVLPPDLQAAPLVSKPVQIEEVTRLAVDSFPQIQTPSIDTAGLDKQAARIARLQARIQSGEQRRDTQKRRFQRLQVTGTDPWAYQLAADLLEQMNISLELMTHSLSLLLRGATKTTAGDAIRYTITDGMIDPQDPKSVQYWADHFHLGSAELLLLAEANGWSARLVARARSLRAVNGPVRKSDALD